MNATLSPAPAPAPDAAPALDAASCPSFSCPNDTPTPQDPTPHRLITCADLGIAMSSPVAGGSEKPHQWERHRHAIMTDLAPIGTMETIAAEDVAQLLWELDRCRRQRVKAIDEGQVHLEEDVEAMVKNPKLARTRIEKIVVEKLRPCYERNARRRDEETEAQRECDQETIRAGLARIRDLRTVPDEDLRKVIRSEEGAIRRALKDAMAEIRRLRKERQALESIQKPKSSRRRPEPVDRSPIQEPIAKPSIKKIDSVAILQAIATLLQPTMADAVRVETPETLPAARPQDSLHEVAKSVQIDHVEVPNASVNEELVEVARGINPEPEQIEKARAARVEPGPSPPVTSAIPAGKPLPNGIIEAPIVRPPTQQGIWVGLGGIPILYEKPKPRV